MLNASSGAKKKQVTDKKLLNISCRSRSPQNLKIYQTRIDNLKPNEIIRVNI